MDEKVILYDVISKKKAIKYLEFLHGLLHTIIVDMKKKTKRKKSG